MWEPRQSPTSVLMGAARSRSGGALGPHILSSPPGTAAPIDAINYTPKTGEIHQPGVLAPVHEQNYSLIPSGQVQGGMGMGAGAAQTGGTPVVPGQERLTGRYSPPPSMASGTNSPGQPPLRPTPYSTGPGPRSQPSGPASAPFGQRGSMAGTAKGWGAGQEMGAGDNGTDTGGVDLSKVPQTLSDAEIQAELSQSGGGGSQPVTPTPAPASGGEQEVTQDEIAASTPKGFHVEPAQTKPDPDHPGQSLLIPLPVGTIVYLVSDDGSTRIPQYVITGPPDPATHQPHTAKIDDKTRALIMGQPPTSKSAQHLRLPNADGTYHVWIVDPTTGQPTQDLTPNGGAPMPKPKATTDPGAARNIQPGKTQTVGGYFIYTQQPDGSWKLDPQATQDLINIKAQSGSAAAAAIRAQTSLDTSKLWQVTQLSDGRTVAVDLHDPVKDDGSPNTVELGPADPTKNLYTAGNTVLQYNGDTKQFTPIYTAPSNYSFQTIGGKLMAIDPLDPSKKVDVAEDPYFGATQQASIEQTRANTQQILENVAKGDVDIETARESLLKDVYGLTHPQASLTSKGYFVPSGANLTVDYGGYGGKGKEDVSGGPLPQAATDLANEVRARLDALDAARAQRAKDVSQPAVPPAAAPAAPAPAAPAPDQTPAPAPDIAPPPSTAPSAWTPPGGSDYTYPGPPPWQGATPRTLAQQAELEATRGMGTSDIPEGSNRGAVGSTLDVGVTPDDSGGDGGDAPPDLNVLDSFGGAGQEDFMGRGLTPQAGRGSTGAGWNPQGGMAAGDPLLQRALQRRGKMGMGSGQGPTSPTPAPPGASLQGQTGGAPGQQGWTPPVPPQEVAGIGHRFGQQMDQGEPQHSGVDLQALEGTPTISPVDGVVERVEHNPAGLGLTVIVRGKDGSEHRLGHLSRTKAFPGMLVAQGQDLGSEVGASGNTTGSHLHWGVRDPQGQPVDPTGAMPPQMQQMPPVPGTEMMGPPGGNGGGAQQGAGQIGAGGELEDLLDATKPMDVEKYRTNPMATRRALSMWGGANLGKPSSVWQPLQEWYPSDPGYPGTGQEDFPQDKRGIDYTGIPKGPYPSSGPVPNFAGGTSETPFQDTVRWIKEQIKLLDQYGAGQATPMQGGGMASQSPDYQQGYQDGVAASKSPGTPPIFIPSMRQPTPSMADQQDQQQGAGHVGGSGMSGGGGAGQEPDPNMPGWSLPVPPDMTDIYRGFGSHTGGTGGRLGELRRSAGGMPRLPQVEIDPDTAFGTGQDSMDSRWDMYEAKDTQGFWGPPGQPRIGSGGEGGMGAGGVYVKHPDGSMHWDETAPDPNPSGGSVVEAGTEHNPGGGKVIQGANRQSGPTGPGGTGPAGSQARAAHVAELARNPSFRSGTSDVSLWSGADPSAVGSAMGGVNFGGPGGWTPVSTPSTLRPLADIQKQLDPFNWNAGILSTPFDPSRSAITRPGVRTPQQLGLPGGGNEMGTGGEGGMGAGDVAGVSPDANAQYQTELQIAQIQAQQAHDAAQKQFDVGMAQVNANLAAESDRHAEAISQLMQQAAFHADDVALKQAEDAENTRHNQAMEQLQAQATQMQQTLEQMREANSIQLEQMQEGAQIKLQQGDQAFKDWQQRQSDRMSILSSALNNPWLQKLTGLTPAPGVNEGVTGGQNLANLIQQVQQPFNPNAPGGGGGGQVFAGQQGAPQIDTPSWSQWQGWDPFQKAAYRTNVEALGPGVWNQVQSGLQSQYAAQGGNPNITQMQAAAATPTQAIGQEMTGELFGQTQPAWQASQQKQWSQSQAPNVKQNLSGIAA